MKAAPTSTKSILLCSLLALAAGCSKDEKKSSSESAAAITGMPEALEITGSLAIDPATTGAAPDLDLSGKPVELVSDSGEVIATANAGANGAFTIAVQTSGLGLTDGGGASVPRLARLRSLFLVGSGEDSKAAGIKTPVILSSGAIVTGADGKARIDTGTHDAKAVGAIVGNVTLETGGDPTGIEVYIPGTTDIAKTDGAGQFLIGFLPAGSFALRADTNGFNSVEWDSVVVLRQQTTHIKPTVMQIATGPKIEAMELTALDDTSGTATLRLFLKSASKYRLSKVADFSDTTFKPVDAATPDFSVSVAVPAGVRLVTLYLEAADSGGLSAIKNLVIDRDAPYSGTLKLSDDATVVSSLAVPLVTSVKNATQMRFSETIDGLATATPVTYAETYTFTLQDGNDGLKTIYVEYLDDAGNSSGSGGEIFAKVTLDRTAPPAVALTLLAPATPTGAFNTPLAWQSSLTEPGITYEVEVFDNSGFTGSAIRTMTTTETNTNVSPPLVAQTTYYWRIRAVDASGNAGAWVVSGSAKSFSLRVLAESYQPRRELIGVDGTDVMYARELTAVPDVNGDGRDELAYSIMATAVGTCPDCGVVRVFDQAHSVVLANLTENLRKSSHYGAKVTTCDLTGDGVDEIVVAAPTMPVRRGGYLYYNVGGVFVYDSATFARVASVTADLGATDPAPGFSYCHYEWDPTTMTSNYVCGWEQNYIDALDGMSPGGNDGTRYFGQNIVCARKSGADDLLIGEPGYQGTNGRGRIGQYSQSGDTLAVARTVESTNWNWNSDFGSYFTYLANFKYTDSGTCGTGPTLVVGSPEEWMGGNYQGGVTLYQLNVGTWTSCATILPDASFDWSMRRFGARLANLGDLDGDGAIEELSVSTQSWEGGIVRIYGGTAGTQLKSIKKVGREFGGFGYKVVPAGNFNGSITELAITSPNATANGHMDSGAVFIYELSAIDNVDNVDDGAPMLTLTGRPAGGALFGAGFVSNLLNRNLLAKPDSMFITSPARRSAGADSGMPGCPGCPPPGGMAGEPTGAMLEIAFLRLAPALPFKIVGESSHAKLGSGILGYPDIDGDGADDVVIAQNGGRCMGRPYGMISLYSVLDARITRSLCAVSSSDELGAPLLKMPGGRIGFSDLRPSGIQSGVFGAITPTELLQFNDLTSLQTAGPWNSNYVAINSIGINKPTVAVVGNTDAGQDTLVFGDGEYDDAAIANTGVVRLFRFINNSNTMAGSELKGGAANDGFGTSVSSTPEISGDIAVGDMGEVVVGSPGEASNSVDGVVYVLNRNFGGGNITSTTPLLKIVAKDAVDTGTDAQAGFGSFVLGLPNFGTYDATGTPFVAEAYVYVANTNLSHTASSTTPEYFIFAIRHNAGIGTYKLVKYGTGVAGSMLGGFARVLPDINGDGVADLAISHPGGTGQLGQTGQVQIISGKGLTTPTEDDDLMQVLYNPDPATSNFGVAVEYSDMTGDGLADFLVGANEYDTPAYQDAGATYVFRMAPVK